jgi:acetyl/propionyl-CoA carboxylase alpha subunit
MKLELTINGRETSIELLTPAPACRYQFGNAPERGADVESPVPGVYTVLLDGRSYDAFVEPAHNGLIVSINGYRFDVDVRDPRRLSRKSTGVGAGGVQTLSSPMPGKVVRVLVGVGDAVTAGQGVLVIEAMKMQNELKTARAGTVLSISAKEGTTVVAGEPLATIG